MRRRRLRGAALAALGLGWVLLMLVDSAWGQPTFPKAARYAATVEERAAIEGKVAELARAIEKLPAGTSRDLLDDVAVFLQAGRRALRFEEFFAKGDVATTLAVLDRGLERAKRLAEGPSGAFWTTARGAVGRGFTSRVDGSAQPYAVIVPEGLETSRSQRARLDVVLHGRDQSISEARFLARWDGKPAPPDSQGRITLHVFGRGNNAYRWAGETDVLEAIEAVERDYPIDDRRVVLRGFSMGGAGAWHLGLHHPSRWSSVEAGAGFTETRDYAKLRDVPPVVDKSLQIYDSVDYALNAFGVPMVGYGGEEDPQLRASMNIVDALKRLGFTLKVDGLLTRGEGIDFLHVVGAKMGHRVDPASARVMAEWHDSHAARGANLDPSRIRFATYTLKYPRVGWLGIEQLVEHYRRAEIDAEKRGSKVVVSRADNVAVLSLDRHAGASVELLGEELPLENAAGGRLPRVYYRREASKGWRLLGHDESRALEENVDRAKRPGLQGPIDDAFMGSFLCARGTGTPWSPAVARWSTDRLSRFRDEWATYMRGEIRVKDDVAVTPDDIENHHLILFGDPGSNRLIARVLGALPVSWTRGEVKLAGNSYPAADHAPALVAPNPLNPRRYVVINSGHTFGARDFIGTNALLYPRLGDHAVFHAGGPEGRLVETGYFDEGWSLRRGPE